MDSPRRGSRVRMAAALMSVAVVVPATAALAAESPVAQLRLVAASSAITVEHWPGEHSFWLNLGTHMVAGSTPFEVRVKRASYNDPIVAHLVARGAGTTRAVPLPDGLVTAFSGFPAFTHVTITDESGAVVHERDEDFCPNTFGTSRTRPDAPATSPYPQLCPIAPFTVGSVWGIQAGWSAQTASEMLASDPLSLPDGTYTATVSVNQPYRELFGIPDGQSSATVTLIVRTADLAGTSSGEPLDAARQPATGHTGHAAGTTAGRPASAVGVPPRPTPAAQRPTGPAGAPSGPRPDLRPLPAWWINLAANLDGHEYLAFDATVWNAGSSPLVVDGFRRAGQNLMDAYQYFFDAQGNQTGYVPAGTMEWDARDGHDHWHFTAFAQYRLLDASRTTVLRSGKEAFCLANTDSVDYTVPNAVWRPTNTDLGTSCGVEGSVAIRQVLDVGNGDTYTQNLPGQSFDITGLPNGTYYIEVTANPENRLQESNTANNVSYRTVILGGEPGNRTLTVPPFRACRADPPGGGNCANASVRTSP